MIDINAMAVPLAGDNPAGENLEYDPLYMGMEAMAKDTPSSEMGDSTFEGKAADWGGLTRSCVELWNRTRDLRVAVYLTVAQTVLEGLPGLTACFRLLEYLVSDLWDDFYPRLDPADNFDPVERLNILSMLSPDADSYGDSIMFILRFRDMRLTRSLAYTLRDVMTASGEMEGEKTADTALIRAEMLNAPAEEVEAQAESAYMLKASIERLRETMDAKMKDGGMLSMEALIREVRRLCEFHDTLRKARAAGASGAPPAESPDTPPADASAEGAKPSAGGGSRAEALAALRRSAEYFRRNEPSSPVPFLLDRALRLADMNFLDILTDIAPDAAGRGKDVLGVKGE